MDFDVDINEEKNSKIMNEKPLVSILLLSMNHENFIEKCILSLTDQTYKNIEIIYLDNASSDRTLDIGKRLLEQSGIPHKIFSNKESKGISKNLNFLLRFSSGQYISPLSADDWFTIENIQKKVDFFCQHQETGMVFSNGWLYYQEEEKTVINDSSRFMRGHIFKEILTVPDCIFYAGSMYSRNIFESVGDWDEKLLIEDLDMYIRIALKSNIEYIDEPLVFYRKTKSSVSKNKNFMIDGCQQYYKKYKNAKWINMDKWLGERYRAVAAFYIDENKNNEAYSFLREAIKLNPFSLNNHRTLFYLIKSSLT